MASVFKLGRDKKKKNAPWYFEFKDHKGRKRMRKGFTDKGATQQLATKLETEAEMRRKGLIDGDQEERAERKRSDIKEHLRAYRTSLEAKKNTEKHVKLIMGRIERIVEGCGFATLGDLDATEVEDYLTKLRKEDDIGYRTYNHYLQAIDGWCNWMVQRKRLKFNPVAGIARLNAELDVRHPRRALTTSEFGQLLKSARESGLSIQCYTGEERARIYTLSYMTGLRKGELASLTPKSFDLQAKQPTVTVEAKASKHRKKDVLPVHPDLIPMIHDWTKSLKRSEPLFPKLAKRRTWLMVKKDLERVDIAYRNEDGIADFHAAGRHTHITELLRNGASVPEAKELARHSDVRTTMKYTHISLEDQAKALRALPAPSCQDTVRKPTVQSSRGVSSSDAKGQDGERVEEVRNPSEKRGCDADRHKKPQPDTDGKKWRRRESNPRPVASPRKLLRV